MPTSAARFTVPLLAGIAGASGSCAVSPLTNKIAVGDDPFLIVVGEGKDGNTDLFAAPAGGGTFYQVTFNRPVEALPRLAPSGRLVAFVRRSAAGATGAELVVLDLSTAAERSAPLPDEAGPVERIGWSSDGGALFLAAGRLWAAAPSGGLELHPVPADSASAADSATWETLGEPVFAVIERCGGGKLCVRAGKRVTPLGDASEAIRWGPDSLATLERERLEVRPLGGGRPRHPTWTGTPAGIRQPTYHPGAPRR